MGSLNDTRIQLWNEVGFEIVSQSWCWGTEYLLFVKKAVWLDSPGRIRWTVSPLLASLVGQHLAYWYFLRPEGGQCQSLNSPTLPVPTLLCPWFKSPWIKLSDHCQIPKGYWKRPSYQIFKLSMVVKSNPFWEHGDYSINACWLNKGIQTFTRVSP